MRIADRIRQLTWQAQQFLPTTNPDYGARTPADQHAAGWAAYPIGACNQEPILALPLGTLPDGSYCVATARGDAALCTRTLSHTDIDDRLLEYSDRSVDLPELLADRTQFAWQAHIGTAPAWISCYRTYAGWRILTPWHADAHIAALQIPGCDPRYCYVTHRQQGLHRIRLLPKRWRDREFHVATQVIFRGSASQTEADLLDFHDAVCCAPVDVALVS